MPDDMFNFNPTVPSKFGFSTDVPSVSSCKCVVYQEFAKVRQKLIVNSDAVSSLPDVVPSKRGRRSGNLLFLISLL